MPAPRKYPDELKERATRLALDARRDATTRRGAIARIAGQLDIHPEALRGWVRWAEAAASGAVARFDPARGRRPRTSLWRRSVTGRGSSNLRRRIVS
ncbi:MAG: transposase [Nocardioides sp.]